MKPYLAFLSTFFLFCSVNMDVLMKQDAVGETTLGKYRYYIVEPHQLPKARKAETLTYLGSTPQYHLMRVWSKVLYSPEEIHFFAVAKSKCQIYGETVLTEDSEIFHGNYRPVEIVGDTCLVE